MNYSSMKGRLHDGLLKGLEVMGYETMSPVQQKTLNEMPNFRADVLAQAKTGTGKTIAFLLPALHSLLTQSSLRKGQVGILILSPTRELALQIAKECDALTAQLQNRPECHTAYGGTSKATEQRKFLNGDPKILVATPGRLNDYLSDEYVAERFQNVQTLVLDEADTMLESGFLVAINDILRRLPPKSKGWQGMCFSATVPPKVKDVLSKVLKSNYTHLTTVDPNETPTIELVTQHSVVIPSVAQTYSTLYAILMKEYETSPKEFKAIVFGTTANGVALMHALFSRLLGNQMSVFQLQSRLSQNGLPQRLPCRPSRHPLKRRAVRPPRRPHSKSRQRRPRRHPLDSARVLLPEDQQTTPHHTLPSQHQLDRRCGSRVHRLSIRLSRRGDKDKSLPGLARLPQGLHQAAAAEQRGPCRGRE
jgi:ATP-dependent RNA helicase MSS116